MGHPNFNILAKLGQLPEDKQKEFAFAVGEVERLNAENVSLKAEIEELKKEIAILKTPEKKTKK